MFFVHLVAIFVMGVFVADNAFVPPSESEFHGHIGWEENGHFAVS
jgi:hypothetical protein